MIKRFGLSVIGALTVNPDVMPGAEQLSEIREVIEHEKAKCIFSEPQFNPNIINSIASDTGVKTGVLDPLGANIDKGKNMYFDLIKDIWDYFKVRKKYWLAPLIITILLMGTLLIFTQGSVIAPFIYTIF